MATQSDLDELETALKQGVRRVTFADGRTVEYLTFDEMSKRISYIRQQLGQEATTDVRFAKYTKGIQC